MPTPVEQIISNLTAPFDVVVAPTLGRLFISDPGGGVIFISDMEAISRNRRASTTPTASTSSRETSARFLSSVAHDPRTVPSPHLDRSSPHTPTVPPQPG